MRAPPGSAPDAPRVIRVTGTRTAMVCTIFDALAGGDPAALMAFAADGDLLAGLTADLATRLGPTCRVIGCSSAGGFAFDGYDDGGVVVIAFPRSGFRVEATWLRNLRHQTALDWMHAIRAVDDRVGEAPGSTRFGILLIDGLSQREELVAAMVDATLPGLLVLGGSAGDGLRFRETRLVLDGESHPDSAIFCLMATRQPVKDVIFDHISPTGTRLVVTDARPEARLILEINAEPAAEEYARLVGVSLDALEPTIFAENPLLQRIGGRNFVHAIREVTPHHGLRLMSSVETGMVMTIGRATDLIAGLERRFRTLGGGASLILGFDCILRRIALEHAGMQQTVADLYRRYNVAGFNTYGEQHGGLHVNQTFVGLAFLDGAIQGSGPGQEGAGGARHG